MFRDWDHDYRKKDHKVTSRRVEGDRNDTMFKNKKDYEKAQRILIYDDKTRNWRQRTEKIEVGDVTSKKNKSAEEKKIQKEIEAQQAEIMRIEIERQAEKKRIAEEKLKEKQRIKNKKTTKKKQDIEEAKEWYGKDITLTRERFEKYNEMKRVEQEISELPDRYTSII